SSQRHEPYDADLVRIIHGDANPAGPGLKIKEIEPGFAGRYPSRFQPVHSGSCGVVTMPAPIGLPDPCTIVVRVQPWLLDGRPQTVLSLEPLGIALSVAAEGAVLEAQGGRVQVSAPMLQRRWYELRIIASAGALRLRQTALQRSWGVADSGEAEMPGAAGALGRTVFGARTTVSAQPYDNPYSAFFNGRIEDPAVLEGALLSEAPIDPSQTECLAWWDFGIEIPEGMPSGVYGVRLRCGELQDIVPFYVLPPRGRTTAPIAFLASTFTYQIYGNHQRGNLDDAFRNRHADWGAYPWNADDHPEYAGSTYNKHSDGSGICYSSMRRPLLTMRPGYITYVDNRGSGLRHFPADTHLIDWLTVKGIPFDVITDHDLDREGVSLLRPYRAVVTGSHPEYHTPNTLNALRDYLGNGGRLAYLGGNGFYWRIANSAAIPNVVEVRRAEGGIRAWAAEPGEYFHALDGAYGGLWRRNGRPPQELCGVGFSAQGLFEGSYYRRMPGAED